MRDLMDHKEGTQCRDRLLLVSAIATALLTILGAAGEAIGIDKYLKTNTVARRTLSLLNQGLFHYAALPNNRYPQRCVTMRVTQRGSDLVSGFLNLQFGR